MASYSEIIDSVYSELNEVRSSPKDFAEKMQSYLNQYKANNAKHRKGAVPIMTREGPAAVQEAIQVLQETDELSRLEWSDGLRKAAQDHCNDTGSTGIVGHIGSRENTLQDRLEEFGKWNDCIAEAIDYGSIDGFEIVCSFLVDDGLSSRPHRNAILNPRFKKVGVGCGPHTEYKTVGCVVFAGEFTEKEETKEVEVPSGGIQVVKEVEDWLEGAVKMTCEVRTEMEGGKTVKKIKKYWEMGDGSTEITESTEEE